MIWLLAVEVAVFASLLYLNWTLVSHPYRDRLVAWLHRRSHEREFAEHLTRDPRPGQRLPPMVSIARGRDHVQNRLTTQLVVFGGPLSTCCTKQSVAMARTLRLDFAAGVKSGRIEVLLVLQGEEGNIRSNPDVGDLQAPLAADPDGRLAEKYNAFWTPRLYVLQGGRLKWVQKEERFPTSDLMRVIGADLAPRS